MNAHERYRRIYGGTRHNVIAVAFSLTLAGVPAAAIGSGVWVPADDEQRARQKLGEILARVPLYQETS